MGHLSRIGKQNKHVLDTHATAYRCCLNLTEKGITVLGVFVGNTLPEITVQQTRKLKTEVVKITGTGSGITRTREALHMGCKVVMENT